MANKFYRDDDGLWWIDNKVIVPSKDFAFEVDNAATPTTFTLKGANNTFFERNWTAVTIATIQDEAGDPYEDWATFKAAIRDFFTRPSVQHTGLKLTAPAETTLTNAGEWYPIQGVFTVSPSPKGFKIIEGVLTFTGLNFSSANFNGTSDLKSDTNTKVFYGLFRNEETEPASISEHDFTTANKTDPMVIADVVELMTGDELFLRAKSETAGTKITPNTLSTTLFCDR